MVERARQPLAQGMHGRPARLAVTSACVIGILAAIWHEKAATARKLPQCIRAVMEWAVAMDFEPDNPCGRIGPVLGAQGKVVRHMGALPHDEVAADVRP